MAEIDRLKEQLEKCRRQRDEARLALQKLRELMKLPTDNTMSSGLSCSDCLRPYGDEYGFPDLVLPDSAWKLIAPKEGGGGVLCPNCICLRLHKVGLKSVPATFGSGPIRSVDPFVMTTLLRTERLEERIAALENDRDRVAEKEEDNV